MAAMGTGMFPNSLCMAFSDFCDWMSGLCKDCCAPTAHPVRIKVAMEQQEPAQYMGVPRDKWNPTSFQAPEVMSIRESSVSPAVFFQGTGSSSMLSNSLSSSSFPSSSSSSSFSVGYADTCRIENPPAMEETTVVFSAMPCEKSAASATALAVEEVECGTCNAALDSDQGGLEASAVMVCAQLGEAAEPKAAFPVTMRKQQNETGILAAPLAEQQAEMEVSPVTLDSQPVETEALVTYLSPQDEAEAWEAWVAAENARMQEELEHYDNPNKPIKMPKEVQERMDLVVQQLKDWIVMDQVALRSVERHLTVPRRYWL
ncbi:hypothetical protein VaNZ11_009203 [Volvox africanus]|uniref:Uncharacterized protein n=1 Tax=Volvox africanus TaxID=51714 RepID=A0ABQ5S727_9CHLO|nr:hypothetical protein VaNZ11_009203 [Volvox africanus]